jgi:hypothetical protein
MDYFIGFIVGYYSYKVVTYLKGLANNFEVIDYDWDELR